MENFRKVNTKNVLTNEYKEKNGLKNGSDIQPGVYLIGDYYIGQSKDIIRRLRLHLNSAINSCHYNKKLGERILQDVTCDTFSYVILSQDINQEYFFYKKYKALNFPLLNQDGNENNLLGYKKS